MSTKIENIESTTVEQLFAEFNEGLRCQGQANFALLKECPANRRRELLALMNVAALAYRALEPDRVAHVSKSAKIAV